MADVITNGDVTRCVGDVSKAVRGSNGATKAKLRMVLGVLTPLLVASADPRIVAVGLALEASSAIFLGKPRAKRKNGGER